MSCLTYCDALTSPYDRTDMKTSSYACSRRRFSSKVSKSKNFFNMEFNVYEGRSAILTVECNSQVCCLTFGVFQYKIRLFFQINESGLWYSREPRAKDQNTRPSCILPFH